VAKGRETSRSIFQSLRSKGRETFSEFLKLKKSWKDRDTLFLLRSLRSFTRLPSSTTPLPLSRRRHDEGDDRRTALPTSFFGTVRVLSSLFSLLSPFSGTVRGGLTSLSLFRRGHHCLCVFRRSTLRDFRFLRSISLHFICYVFWNLISPLFLKFDIKKLMLCYVFLCSDFSVLMFCFLFSFLMLLLLCGCVAWKNVYNCWRRGSVLVLLVDLLPQNCRWSYLHTYIILLIIFY